MEPPAAQPSLVAGGVAAADPSSLCASMKEGAAGAMGTADALESGTNLELFSALAGDRSIPAMRDPKTLTCEGTREQQLQSLKPQYWTA